MSDELSIKVLIGGRTYPLTIDRSEEEVIRETAKQINESIKVLQDNYAVKDMQDLIAMAALQIATQEKNKKDSEKADNTVIDHLKELNQAIDIYLSE